MSSNSPKEEALGYEELLDETLVNVNGEEEDDQEWDTMPPDWLSPIPEPKPASTPLDLEEAWLQPNQSSSPNQLLSDPPNPNPPIEEGFSPINPNPPVEEEGFSPINPNPPVEEEGFSPINPNPPVEEEGFSPINPNPPVEEEGFSPINPNPPVEEEGFSPINPNPPVEEEGFSPINPNPPVEEEGFSPIRSNSFVPFPYQDNEGNQFDQSQARFQRTDQWLPVYTWLESLETDEVIKSQDVIDWLTANKEVKDDLYSRHSRYHLMHYIKKCHLKILKRKEKKKGLPTVDATNSVKIQKNGGTKLHVPLSCSNMNNVATDSEMYVAKRNEAFRKYEILVEMEQQLATLFTKREDIKYLTQS